MERKKKISKERRMQQANRNLEFLLKGYDRLDNSLAVTPPHYRMQDIKNLPSEIQKDVKTIFKEYNNNSFTGECYDISTLSIIIFYILGSGANVIEDNDYYICTPYDETIINHLPIRFGIRDLTGHDEAKGLGSEPHIHIHENKKSKEINYGYETTKFIGKNLHVMVRQDEYY